MSVEHSAKIEENAKVLILVVVEDAQWDSGWRWKGECTPVLILVVVEDAQWGTSRKRIGETRNSLNPCCSGRCSVSFKEESCGLEEDNVLILVVVEDAQWVKEESCGLEEDNSVLILVVVEDAQWDNKGGFKFFGGESLNPCCSGRCSVSKLL